MQPGRATRSLNIPSPVELQRPALRASPQAPDELSPLKQEASPVFARRRESVAHDEDDIRRPRYFASPVWMLHPVGGKDRGQRRYSRGGVRVLATEGRGRRQFPCQRQRSKGCELHHDSRIIQLEIEQLAKGRDAVAGSREPHARHGVTSKLPAPLNSPLSIRLMARGNSRWCCASHVSNSGAGRRPSNWRR